MKCSRSANSVYLDVSGKAPSLRGKGVWLLGSKATCRPRRGLTPRRLVSLSRTLELLWAVAMAVRVRSPLRAVVIDPTPGKIAEIPCLPGFLWTVFSVGRVNHLVPYLNRGGLLGYRSQPRNLGQSGTNSRFHATTGPLHQRPVRLGTMASAADANRRNRPGE